MMDLFRWLKDAYGEGQRPAADIPEDPCAPQIRRRYRFSGCVQGVGFRYEAKRSASRLGLGGWVRNESDGTVVVELEGGEGRIGAFLRAMQAVPRFDITDIQAEDLPLSGDGEAFKMLY